MLPRRPTVEVGDVVTPVITPARRATVDKGIDRIEISLGTQIVACGMSYEWTLDNMAVIGIRRARTTAKASKVVHVGLQLTEFAVAMTTIRSVRITELAKSAMYEWLFDD